MQGKDYFYSIIITALIIIILCILFTKIYFCTDKIYIFATIITSIGVIITPFVLYLIQKRNNQNKLFTKIIEEYSTREMNDAIRSITGFVKNLGCEISKDDLNNFRDQAIIDKKVKIIQTYKKLHDEGILGIENDKRKIFKYEWEKLDYQRRILNNFFVKINLLCEKNLINKTLLKEFWSINSIKFLSQYIITLVYVGLTFAHGGNDQEDSMKPAYLVDFYNKYFVTKEQIKLYFPNLKKINLKDFRIELEDLRKIFNCCKCKDV